MEERMEEKEIQRIRMLRQKKRRRRMVRNVLIVILILAVLGGAAAGLYLWRYSPGKERYDVTEYFGVSEGEAAVIVDGQLAEARGRLQDGVCYVPCDLVTGQINQRFYWDANDQAMLYTMPDGVRRYGEGEGILLEEGVPYISADLIKQYTDMELNIFQDPVRVVMNIHVNGAMGAMVTKDTQVRYRGGVKSPILTDISSGAMVRVLETGDKWHKVCTADGFIGYVQARCLETGEFSANIIPGEPQQYPTLNDGSHIRMAWHQTTNQTNNAMLAEELADTNGINVICPTWFYFADEEGNVNNLCSYDYVALAHERGMKVWALVDNFTQPVSTYNILSYSYKRSHVIDQLVAAALEYGIDGLNLDFEELPAETGPSFVQFVRELALRCHEDGLVLSVDNHIPYDYNAYYGREEQGVFADYVILMNYDEHQNEQTGAGSVASLNFVRSSLDRMLEDVPAGRLINGVPFYTRIWKSGTGADGTQNLEWSSVGMDNAARTLEEYHVTSAWDDATQQNYASYTDEQGRICQVWLEDAASMRKKLETAQAAGIAGIAGWKLGLETPDIWDLILEFYP